MRGWTIAGVPGIRINAAIVGDPPQLDAMLVPKLNPMLGPKLETSGSRWEEPVLRSVGRDGRERARADRNR